MNTKLANAQTDFDRWAGIVAGRTMNAARARARGASSTIQTDAEDDMAYAFQQMKNAARRVAEAE